MKSKSTNSQRFGIKALAKELGHAPNTIRRYLRMTGAPKPDAEKRYRKAEVSKWIDFQRSGGPELANIKAEHREADLGFARLQLRKARASAVPREDCDATFPPLAVELNGLLRKAFESPEFLKNLQGRYVAEIRRMIESTYDATIAAFKGAEEPLPLKATTAAGGKPLDPKVELASIAAEIRQIELGLAERRLVPMAEVEAAALPGCIQFSSAAEHEYERQLPGKLVGKTAAEMLPLLEAARFRVMRVFAESCRPIMTPAAFAALEAALGAPTTGGVGGGVDTGQGA